MERSRSAKKWDTGMDQSPTIKKWDTGTDRSRTMKKNKNQEWNGPEQ